MVNQQMAGQVWHAELRKDIQEIMEKFADDPTAFELCGQNIEAAFKTALLKPISSHSAVCEFQELAQEGYRKMKFFSGKREPKLKPDLRLIYRYDEEKNEVHFLAAGFRLKEIPRPAKDPYSQANTRLLDLLRDNDE